MKRNCETLSPLFSIKPLFSETKGLGMLALRNVSIPLKYFVQFVQSVLNSGELQSLAEAGNETVSSVLKHQTVLQAVQQGSQLINNYNLRYFLGR